MDNVRPLSSWIDGFKKCYLKVNKDKGYVLWAVFQLYSNIRHGNVYLRVGSFPASVLGIEPLDLCLICNSFTNHSNVEMLQNLTVGKYDELSCCSSIPGSNHDHSSSMQLLQKCNGSTKV